MKTVIVTCQNCGVKNRIPDVKQHLYPKCGRCKNHIDMRLADIGPVELDDATFEGFISRTSLPVVVDFYSPTCGPCQTLAPLIKKLARNYLGRFIVASLDTSRFPAASARHQIRGVPTLIFFRNGKVVDRLTGAAPESLLTQKLDSLL